MYTHKRELYCHTAHQQKSYPYIIWLRSLKCRDFSFVGTFPVLNILDLQKGFPIKSPWESQTSVSSRRSPEFIWDLSEAFVQAGRVEGWAGACWEGVGSAVCFLIYLPWPTALPMRWQLGLWHRVQTKARHELSHVNLHWFLFVSLHTL